MIKQYKFLVLGPIAKDNNIQGGMTISFSVFLEELQKNNINFEVINTYKGSYKFKIIAWLHIYWLFFKKVRKSTHISLHGTANDYIFLAPIVIFFSKLLGKTVCLRKFAGSFSDIFHNLSFFKKRLVIYALSNSNINFFQTKYLIKNFKQYNKNTYWFPTVRKKPNIGKKKEKTYQKRFIFLGHIRPEKGIDQILEVSKLLDSSYHIDLYGSIVDGKYTHINWDEYTNVNYCGEVKSLEVYNILTKYDVLLLPTYWEGEGYPGVIIEALALGLPVIATSLRGISEIVDENSGILIESKNVDQLKKAILFFNEKNYKLFSQSAYKKFVEFDAEIMIKKIIKQIEMIISTHE